MTIEPLEHPRLDDMTGTAGVYQSPGWLRVTAEMCPGTTRFVTTADGVAALFVVGTADAGRYGPASTIGDNGLGELGLRPGSTVALLLGRAGYASDFSLLPTAPPDSRRELGGALLDAAAGSGADVSTLPFLRPAAAARLVECGLAGPDEIVLQDAAAIVDLAAVRPYPGGLPSTRRSVVERDLRRYERSGLTTRRRTLSAALGFAPRLLANVDRRHGGRGDEPAMARTLRRQAAHLDDASVVVSSETAAGNVVAFSLSYIAGSTLHVRLVGLDYPYVRETAAYFNVAYVEPVRIALDLGLDAVDLGIGSLRPKLLRGGRLEPRYAVFRGPAGRPLSRSSVGAASGRTLARLAVDVDGVADVDRSLLYSP